jgi:hypothetical protein
MLAGRAVAGRSGSADHHDMAENFRGPDQNALLAAQQGVVGPVPINSQGFAAFPPSAVAARSAPEAAQPAGLDAPVKNPESGPENPESGPEDAEPGTDRIGSYDPLTAAREDHAVIVGLLAAITGLLQGLQERVFVQEQERLAVEQLLAAVQQERRLIDELLKNGTNQGPGLGYAASTQAAVIDTETADAAERWPSSTWEKIMAAVKRVSRRLWSMISKLVTVKEWALSGKVGTPGPLLGLFEASVSVTFGR